MHFKNARNASVYAVFRAFFTQSLAKLRLYPISHEKYIGNLLSCRIVRLLKRIE